MINNKRKIIFLIISLIIIIVSIFFFYSKNQKINVLKKYDPETKETLYLQYILKDQDTIFEGKFTCYNEQGHKTYEGNLVNGRIKGKSIFYYETGNIECINYRKNNEILEESTCNYPNGKIMKYLMYDDLGILDFVIRYDEYSNVNSYEGYPLIEIYQYKIANQKQFKIKVNQFLKVGDTLKYKYLIANIPNAKRSFKIENIDNKKAKRALKKTNQTGIDVKEVLAKKGINTIQATVKYEFNDVKKTVINDTVSFKVQVN